jgi:ankyrin repeat protein
MKDNQMALHLAVKKRDYAAIQSLVNDGVDLSVKSELGLDALHTALRMGNKNLLFMLLHYGAGKFLRF